MRLVNIFWAQNFVIRNIFKDKSLMRLNAVTVPHEDPYSMSSLASIHCLFGSNLESYFQLLSQTEAFPVFRYYNSKMSALDVQLFSFSFFLKSSLFLFVLNGTGNTVESRGSQNFPITGVFPFAYKSVKLHFFKLWLWHAGCHLGLNFIIRFQQNWAMHC